MHIRVGLEGLQDSDRGQQLTVWAMARGDDPSGEQARRKINWRCTSTPECDTHMSVYRSESEQCSHQPAKKEHDSEKESKRREHELTLPRLARLRVEFTISYDVSRPKVGQTKGMFGSDEPRPRTIMGRNAIQTGAASCAIPTWLAATRVPGVPDPRGV